MEKPAILLVRLVNSQSGAAGTAVYGAGVRLRVLACGTGTAVHDAQQRQQAYGVLPPANVVAKS